MILLRFKLLMLMQALMSFQWANPRFFSESLDAGIWYKFSATGEWTPDYRYGPYATLEEYQADPALLFRKSLGELTQSLLL